MTDTLEYMEWYRQNTILFLSIAQQLNDSRTTITHNVPRIVVKKTHFSVLHPRSMFCTPSHVHQNFGQTRKSVDATSHEWMTNLFGVDVNTPNSTTSYLAFLQQFDAPYSFGEQ